MHSVPSNRASQINQLETVFDVMINQSEDGKARPQHQTQPILTGHLNISHVSFFHTNDITCDFHHYSASRFYTPPSPCCWFVRLQKLPLASKGHPWHPAYSPELVGAKHIMYTRARAFAIDSFQSNLSAKEFLPCVLVEADIGFRIEGENSIHTSGLRGILRDAM